MLDSFINEIYHHEKKTFFLLAGPCVIEDEHTPLEIASYIKQITNALGIPYIFKASYRKANRSRLDSFTGIGDEKALGILADIRNRLGIPVVTDIHSEGEVALAAPFVDVLQIPAFLCRQTSLLVSAAASGKWVNIKKGQFLSPEAMHFAVDKVRESGNEKVLITERGTTFGYQDLVVDFRGIPVMRKQAPVILDCTHSLQKPNQTSGVTGGLPALIETMARAGVAAGVDGLFIETHPSPAQALSDGANMLPLERLSDLLEQTLAIKSVLSP